MLTIQQEINNLSQSEWADETQEDRNIFDLKNKSIEELYPKGSKGEKGDAGEGYVKTVISDPIQVGWIYRQQSEGDYGIDAQFEAKLNGNPSGRLIAAQIKYGESYVSEHDNHFVFYGKYKHLLYWLNHALPVIIVYVEYKEIQNHPVYTCYWVEVKKEKIKTLADSWKIKIPKTQILNSSNIDKLLSCAPEKDMSDLRFNTLNLQKELMQHLNSGGKVAIELTDTESGLEPYIIKENAKGKPLSKQHWKNFFPLQLVLNNTEDFLFPWAYIDTQNKVYLAKEVPLSQEERDDIISQDYQPSDISEGTTSKFYLRLNSFGTRFLTVDSYISEGILHETTKK